MNPARSRIVVVGSVNVDLVAQIRRLPHAGETVAAHAASVLRGGKGANQAVAAARQGGDVTLIGCVGDDEAGRTYRRHLRREGVDLAALAIAPGEQTGTAMISVDAAGENQIVVLPGANARLTATWIRLHAARIRRAAVVLAQFETPLAAVCESARLARSLGVRFILNPSPWRDDFVWGRVPIATLVVNEAEAALFSGARSAEIPGHLRAVFRRMKQRGVSEMVVTRGARPTWWICEGRLVEVPTLKLRPVDTVGAGDAFTGALAVRLAEGLAMEEAIRSANCAGALATLAIGAQSSLPTRAATERALARLPADRSTRGMPAAPRGR